MKPTPRTWLVLNSASGSNVDDARAALFAALCDGASEPEKVIDLQEGEAPQAPDLTAAGVDRLVVWAGDGSVSAVLQRVQGFSGDVLLLPGGTANLLARELHGDALGHEIAALACAGKARRVRRYGIACSGGVGVVEVLAGPGASWSDVREELREGDLGEAAAKALEATMQSTSGPMVRITTPALGREDGYSGVRLTPVGDRMEVSGYGAQRLVDYVKQGIALLRRDFREGPHDDLGRQSGLECRSIDGSPIELMIDGERATGKPIETFSLAPLEVNLLASVDG